MAKQQKTINRRLFASLLVGLSVSGFGCHAASIQVSPEPWRVLEPGSGTPVAKASRVDVVLQGEGNPINPGDLVELHMKTYWGSPEKTWRDRGSWWILAGSRGRKETLFYNYLPNVSGALIGLKQGSFVRLLDPDISGMSAGRLEVTPFGDPDNYSWRKNIREFQDVYVPTDSGYSQLEIRRVCKGPLKVRTVHLFDDSYIQKCSWAPIHCEMLNTPREAWVDEAKIEAICQDGKTATFEHGPVPSRNGKEWSGPVDPGSYFDSWIKESWKKLPVGVQLK